MHPIDRVGRGNPAEATSQVPPRRPARAREARPMSEPSTRSFATAAQRTKDQRGWSVRDLAAHSGVPVTTVDLAVTTGNVMLSSALRIAGTLGMRTGDLGGSDGA